MVLRYGALILVAVLLWSFFGPPLVPVVYPGGCGGGTGLGRGEGVLGCDVGLGVADGSC